MVPDFFSVVPLGVPLPPDTIERTSLLAAFGLDAAFDPEAFPRELVCALLANAGRPVYADESRLLLWVTPIPVGPDATERLVGALSSEAGQAAIEQLGSRGDPAAIPALCRVLTSPRQTLHGPALLALARLGHPADLDDTDGEQLETRLLAELLLERTPSRPSGLPTIITRWLDQPDAAGALALLESVDLALEVAPEVVARLLALHPEVLPPAAVDLLAAKSLHERWWWSVFTRTEVHHDALIDALQHRDWQTRAGASVVLAQLEVLPDGAEEGLRAARLDDDSDVCREASLALHMHDPSVPLAPLTDRFAYAQRVPPATRLDLATLLHPNEGAEKERVLLALARSEPVVYAPLFEAISLDLGQQHPLALRNAASAALLLTGQAPRTLPELHCILLRSAGPPLARIPAGRAPALIALASRDADWQVRVAALQLLAGSGADAARHHDLLTLLAQSDPDETVRAHAARLLGPRFQVADVADLVAQALVRTPAHPEGRVPALQRLLQLDRPRGLLLAQAYRTSTQRALALEGSRIVGASCTAEQLEGLLPSVLVDLNVENWVYREAAAVLLGSLSVDRLGADRAEELAELLDGVATHDRDGDVRRMAAWASRALRSIP